MKQLNFLENLDCAGKKGVGEDKTKKGPVGAVKKSPLIKFAPSVSRKNGGLAIKKDGSGKCCVSGDMPAEALAKAGVNYWHLFVDGASRNNPGKAGAGIYITKNEESFLRNGFSLGIKTNNQAEYLALLVGVFFLKKYLCKDDIVMIVSDSQLMVRQVSGHYKVKNPDLIPLFKLSKQLLFGINYNIVHVLRDDNKEADEMANFGIDKGKKLPQDFLALLQEHEIQL